MTGQICASAVQDDDAEAAKGDWAAQGARLAHLGMARDRLARRLYRDICDAAAVDAIAALTACDCAMEGLRSRLPEPVFEAGAPFQVETTADIRVWAEFASQGQIAAMLAACMDRIGKADVILEDRKRLLVAVWNTMPPDAKRAFLARVAKTN